MTATNVGLRALLQGELPQPLALELSRQPGELASQRERLGELANLRCVCISVEGHGFTREEVVRSLKEFFVDPGTVAQVFEDGTDWNVN